MPRTIKARRVIPKVCAYCKHYRNDNGCWSCAEDENRAAGDVGMGEQNETTCSHWLHFDAPATTQ